ncbi:PAS domain-containing sensor histidine kinase [Liberibacter sp. Z1]|nr:PAS domain-containing sensor histidine kinase [Candidatus Liberibacter sp.]
MTLDAKFSAFHERKDNLSLVELPAQESFADIENSNKYFTETFWARKNFLCEEDHTSHLNTTDSYLIRDQKNPENQSLSFLDKLNIKNKTTLLFEQNLTDGDTIKSDPKDPFLKGENDLLSPHENFHTINLNQYAQDISPERKTSILQKGKSEHYRDSLHCNHSLFPYFGKGKDLNPASLDKHPTAFLLMHSNSGLLYANPAFFLLTGYKNIKKIEEIGGLSTLLDSQKLSTDERPVGAITLYRSDGTDIAVSAHLHSIRWEKENALAITFIPFKNEAKHFKEIPIFEKRNKKESNPHKLEIEVMQLCSILEIATDGIAILKCDGKVLSTNHSFNTLFGHNEKDIQGKSFTIFFIDEHQKIMSDCLVELSSLDINDSIKKVVVGCTAQGDTLSLHITIKKLPFSACYCLIARNISQWKKAEKENTHKSDFLARVSHEIRTPLNAIIGFSEVIKNQQFGPVGNPRYIEYASYIDQSGNHILDIVNDLLDISKIEAGKMNLRFEPISLNETIIEAISLIKLYANEKRVLVRTSFSNKIPQIFADLRSIKQIALNILSNAIHFTPSGGQIVISTAYKNSKGVILRVRDTGVGMTSCELEKAMKPFGQVPNPEREHERGGTGLGLPLTKAMVDANMGSFSVSSTPEKGTLVEIIFPSQQAV